MNLLKPIDYRERKPLIFSYDGDLADDELVTLLQVDIEVIEGTDPAFATVKDGPALLLSATREVMQWAQPHMPGVTYGFTCLITGSKGGRHISSGRLPVRKLL